ncbi:Sushi, von Willebrand factor type A, EGF and pentraxin domain-containing protein 1 [Holothuria leucospilota]|uniref:Sushi, von Willebrand factor type A, EGF and pentraxin domain-containing protein 1 n=1 Tax=Holothuria leucospilota TaxID=206669 RepID=A0A9Q1BID9_HOLLE|nr:Sushi, von Willebrand factor type A, EGF and pentraxin domain-containing protein 1 [Holothuria leucospilota]
MCAPFCSKIKLVKTVFCNEMAVLQKKPGLIIIFAFFYAIEGAPENVVQESVCDTTQCPVKYGTDRGVECKLIGYNASNPVCVNVWSSYKDCNCTNSNYRISTSGQTYWCNPGGSWDQSLQDLKCLAPCYTDADDEAIATNGDDEKTNLILDSDLVTYTCPPGYHPTGTPTVFCSNGTWGPHEIFQCHGNCSIPDNYITIVPPNEKVILYDHDVTMKCRDGYIPTEEITATCENESFGNIPECQSEFPCSHPNPDSELVNVTPNRTSYNNGSEITYSCPKGYDLEGDEGAVCVDGNWTSVEEPFCTASPCGNPSIDDSRVEIIPNNTAFQHNETVNFSCPSGYDLKGDSKAVCKFGDWEINVDPTCEPRPCDNPNPDDTRVIISPNSTEYHHNETVTFSCPIGYDLKGDTSAVCRLGEWEINVDPTCEPSPCENPRIDDSRVEIIPNNTEFQHNETVNFSCPSGYDLKGNSSAICKFGDWEINFDPTCDPSPCDNPNPDDTRVIISPNSTEYHHNETVNFSCPIGYDLKGDTSAVCRLGEWEINVDPTCDPSPCGNPSIDDSRVEIIPNNTEHQHNETVNFSCPSGYDLKGDSSAVCKFGDWEINIDPTCESSPCDNPHPDDTSVIISPNRTEYYYNETVTFSCPIGYDLKGDTSAVCRLGEWGINVDPTCEPSPCTKPNPDDNMIEISPDTPEYQHNETVTFSCPNGYGLIGDSTGLCQFGHWEISLEPSCHLENISCERPVVEDSLVTLDPDYLKYPNGTTVQFECPEGYGLLGNSTATCLSADWNPFKEPECYALPCDKPSPEDDSVEVKPDKTEYQHNETVEFSCLDGYDLTGASTAICQFGVWDPKLNQTCTPSPCGSPSPDDIRVIITPESSEYQHNDTVAFSCPSGYDLMGDSGATCQFGVWDINVAPTCEPSPCGSPSPDDIRVIITPESSEYQHNDTVAFSCPSGYDLMGDSGATCQFGVWDINVAPTCEPLPCDKPSPEDDSVEVKPDKTEYQHNETVEFSCLDGYDLTGASTAICQFGVWDPKLNQACTPSPCGSPSPDDTRVIITPESSEYQHNDTVAFSCPSGYDLMGDSGATCQFGVWDINVAPTCEPSTCGNPSPEDTRVIITPHSSEYQHNDTVEFSCPSGYDLMGDSDATCQFGDWKIDVAPSCKSKKCLNPYPEDQNIIIEPYQYEYESGSAVHYSCPEGFTRSGSSNATCVFGEWDQPHDSPTCEAKGCERPKVKGVDFEPNEETYEDGETITFFCPKGETLVGSESSNCTLGVFSPSSFPSCVGTTSEFCNSSSLKNKDEIVYTPDYETYAKGEQINLSCKNLSLVLTPFVQEMECQGNDNWSRNVPACEACRNSEMCQTSSKRVCDKQTSLCVCPPGYEPFEGDCIETIAIETVVSLDGDFDETLNNKSSNSFVNLAKNVCDAFEKTLTYRTSNVKDGYVSCIVESFINGSIIADVVTTYSKEENVKPQQVTDIIATEAKQNDNTLPGLGLHFTNNSVINSTEKVILFDACAEKTDVCDPGNADCHYDGISSYNCTCKVGFIDTIPNITGVSCVPEVRDPPIALTVGLGAGVALCFVVLLVTSVAIFAKYTYHDDRKKMLPHDSKEEDNINDPLAPSLPKDDEPKQNSADTHFVNHGYNLDEYTPSALDPVSETARMSAIANTIQNMGNMKPMPRIKPPPPENNHNYIIT